MCEEKEGGVVMRGELFCEMVVVGGGERKDSMVESVGGVCEEKEIEERKVKKMIRGGLL